MYLTNEKTGQYMYYVFNLEVKESAVLQTIELNSNVREVLKKVILLENPLPTEVIIEEKDVVLSSQNIFVSSKFPLKLASNFDFGLELTYRPLIELQEHEQILTINNAKLGLFKYRLLLNSKKSTSIPQILFKCKIGDITTKQF